jgi:hypothetical protein
MYHVHDSGECRPSEFLVPWLSLGQSTLLLGKTNGLSKSSKHRNLDMKSHKELENHLDRYSGLILYMREMDELAYGKLCAVSASLIPYLASVANSYMAGFPGLFFCREPTTQRSNDCATFPPQRLN